MFCVEFTADGISAFADMGMLAITIILAFIARKALGQIEEMKKQNKNEAINQLYTRMFEIQSLLISQGKYEDFFKNEESENKENQSKDFEIYTQMHADFLDQIMIQKDQLANPSNWENYVNDVLKKSSRVENYIKKHKELYCNELFKMCR